MPLPTVTNLFPPADGMPGRESFATLQEGRAFTFEHIVSRGEASPPDFWYDQERDEWVMLARGEALLRFEEGDLNLTPGDSLTIPAGVRHRVEMTSNDAVWLALHFRR